jgi:ribosomal protein S18 acetylase RimI-like enzyme
MGIGNALMEKAITFLESKSIYKLTLTCREKSVWFYEKYGFEKFSLNMKKYYIKK